MKKNGFTLVEVLVVSIILALLATTATLFYRGYIEDSAQQTVEELAGVAGAAANAFTRKTGIAPTVAQLDLFLNDATRYTVSVDSPYVVVEDTRYSVSDTVKFY